MEAALADADAAIFLIEPGVHASRNQSWEWSTALEVSWDRPGFRMIPVLIDNARLPVFLKDRHALRFRRVPGSADRLLEQLVSALEAKDEKVGKTDGKDRERWLRRLTEIRRGIQALD